MVTTTSSIRPKKNCGRHTPARGRSRRCFIRVSLTIASITVASGYIPFTLPLSSSEEGRVHHFGTCPRNGKVHKPCFIWQHRTSCCYAHKLHSQTTSTDSKNNITDTVSVPMSDDDDDAVIDSDDILEANVNVTTAGNDGRGATSPPSDVSVHKSFSLWETIKENIIVGIEPTPEILAIMTIYFVEGALGLAHLAQTFLLKDELHLGPAEMSALTGVFALPWTIKPVYGFLSDGFPLFGYRRRSYLIGSGVLGALCYWALGADFWGVFDNSGLSSIADSAPTLRIEDVTEMGGAFSMAKDATAQSTIFMLHRVSELQGTFAAFLLGSACIAFSDVVADGIVVQRTRESDDPKLAGGLQSLCWGSSAVGGLIVSYFSGSLLEVIGPRDVLAITALLPAMVAGISFFINEEPVKTGVDPVPADGLGGIQDQVKALWSALKLPGVWKPALFLFMWQSTPTSESAFLYFMTNDLKMGPEFLGRVQLVSAAAGLVGVWGYQKFLRSVAIKDILLWTAIASTPLGLIQLLLITHMNRTLGIPDGAFVFGDDVVLAVLGKFTFLPILVLAAKICPPGVEAVLFATLMSINNGASTVGTEVGALLTNFLGVTENNFDNLGPLTVICSVSSLYPIFFINLLEGIGTESETEMESSGNQNDDGAK